jgi:hypothetical protein
VRRFLYLVVGLGLLGLGAYLLVYLDGSVDFGWYAYTGEEAEQRALDGDVTVLSQTQLVGAACAAAGLMVLAAELGFRSGRKQRGLQD